MANTSNGRKTNSTKSTTRDSASVTQEKTKNIVAKEIDATQYVTVRNGFQGTLVYVSKRTGEKFEWSGFGDEQEMELRELRNAKNSNKKFFENNWFMFDDDWIVDYLGVRNFYKHAIRIDEFDEIFGMKPEELQRRISMLSDGQKRSVAYRAKELISEKKIDSLSAIEVLEKALNIELIER